MKERIKDKDESGVHMLERFIHCHLCRGCPTGQAGFPLGHQLARNLLINYERSVYSLGLFLALSYNLNEPTYINLRSVMWSYLSYILHLLFPFRISSAPRVLLLLSLPPNLRHISCLAIGHSTFYYTNRSKYIFTQCTNPHDDKGPLLANLQS